jgi:hypothetical protein
VNRLLGSGWCYRLPVIGKHRDRRPELRKGIRRVERACHHRLPVLRFMLLPSSLEIKPALANGHDGDKRARFSFCLGYSITREVTVLHTMAAVVPCRQVAEVVV